MGKFDFNIVVGSGPSGVSCAKGLLDNKKKVLMLDVGLEIEKKKKEKKKELINLNNKSNFYEEWVKNFKPINHNIFKQIYSSSFAYANKKEFFLNNPKGLNFTGSYALGGLSNVWGAASLPYEENDFLTWPINLNDLKPYYKKIQNIINVNENIKMSNQGEEILKNLKRKKKYLNKKNFFFNRSKIAVNNSCILCGLCMYGCPYDYIYNTNQTLKTFKRNKKFKYINGLKVVKFKENGKNVIVYAKKISNKKILKFYGKSLFIGSGPLSTAKIVLNSINYKKNLILKQNQIFYIPFLMEKSIKNPNMKNTLSQLFCEINDKNVSDYNIHLQFYTFDNYILNLIESKLIPFSYFFLLKKIIRKLYNKLIISFVYLHSNLSPKIILKPIKKNNEIYFETILKKSNYSKIYLKKILNKLNELKPYTKLKPLNFFSKIGYPGESNHIGGIFPMSNKNEFLKTNKLGGLNNSKKIFIIDSSNFPDIPSKTITLTIMANAYRIGCNF